MKELLELAIFHDLKEYSHQRFLPILQTTAIVNIFPQHV